MNKTYSILICGQLARRWKKPPACGKPHQRLAPPSFALVPALVPQMVSSWNTIAKSAPFPVRSCCPLEATQPLSARLPGSVRFLAIPIPAPPSIHLTVDLPLAGSDTGLPCSVEMTRSRRCSLYAGSVVLPMTKEFEAQVPTAKRAPSIFRSPNVTTLTRVCMCSANPRPISASMLADAPLPRGSDATLCECGYIVRGFQNSPLPRRSAS
jgi:hypothetical protein